MTDAVTFISCEPDFLDRPNGRRLEQSNLIKGEPCLGGWKTRGGNVKSNLRAVAGAREIDDGPKMEPSSARDGEARAHGRLMVLQRRPFLEFIASSAGSTAERLTTTQRFDPWGGSCTSCLLSGPCFFCLSPFSSQSHARLSFSPWLPACLPVTFPAANTFLLSFVSIFYF